MVNRADIRVKVIKQYEEYLKKRKMAIKIGVFTLVLFVAMVITIIEVVI